MDGISSSQLVANGILSLGVIGLINCVKGFRRQKMRGVVVPIGKTMLCSKLSDDSCYIIDLDAYLQENHKEFDKYKHEPSQFVLQMYGLAKAYVKQIANNFKNKKIVLCSSSYDLLVQLGVREKRIWCFIPSQELVEKLPASEEQKKWLERAKYYVATHDVRKYYVINDFKEMYDKVREKLRLRHTLN